MQAAIGERRDASPTVRSGGHWQDVVLLAQQALAGTLVHAAADGRLNRQTYQHWLATESAICRINALALDALADWHVSLPQLRAVAHAWATATRDDALVAAADVRAIDGMAAALPSQLAPWQAFLEIGSRSSRAGEALGAVVLHARLMRGPMRDAIAAVTELPFVPIRGSRYLLQRGQPEAAAGNGSATRCSTPIRAPLSPPAHSARRAGIATRWRRCCGTYFRGSHAPECPWDSGSTVAA